MDEQSSMSPPPEDEREEQAPPARKPKVGVGSILEVTWGVFSKQAANVLLLAVIVMVPIALVSHLLMGTVTSDLEEFERSTQGADVELDDIHVPKQAIVMFTLVTLLGMIAPYVLQGAVTWVTIRHLSGNPVSIGESLSVGLACLLPALGVAFMIFLIVLAVFLPAVLLAFVALPIGILVGIAAAVFMVVLACGLYVAVPVIVAERPGVMASIKRSWHLTKGFKGSIFLVLLVIGMLNGVLAGIVGGIFGADASASMADQLRLSWPEQIVGFAFAAFAAVAAASTYYLLRNAKEGTDIKEIAHVFE